ncbi:MAG TPA: DUF261 family protein [Candidatus Paceibacterota bacterium]|nr:DUF261 family protein [Candidatus Paceibacterota bacterium]
MIFSPIVQNDKRLNEQINKAGCLFRSLVMLAEMKAGHCLSTTEIDVDLYEWLIAEGAMKPNCWVLNHEKVIMAAQHYIGVKQSAKYVMRDEADEFDFDTGVKPNYFIRHVRTKNGTGHFFVCSENGDRTWDPYWPAPDVDYYIGIRGYKL